MPSTPASARLAGRSAPWLLLLLASTLVGLYFASQAAWNPALRGMMTWKKALAINLTCYYLWGAAVPLVVALARRFRPESGRWGRPLLVHAVASVALSVAILLVGELLLDAVFDLRRVPLPEALRFAFAANFHSMVPTYWMVLAGTYAFDYWQALRDRELRASQLEARLAEARLQALRMQLQPHFLFNTLHSISSLMYSDVEAADAMMTRLADLLRSTLESERTPEVPLARELDLVRRYLDIERVRFEERLQVDLDVPREMLAVPVPTLILQPLVENALRHGIERLPGGGLLALTAERAGDRLRLRLANDGPGGEGAERGCGLHVGLANTRERLAQLYGQRWRLELEELPEGGATVTLEVPWRPAA